MTRQELERLRQPCRQALQGRAYQRRKQRDGLYGVAEDATEHQGGLRKR